jgi:hypothetical protein
MRGPRGRSDPTLMLVIVAIAVAIALWRAVSSVNLESLPLEYLAPSALGAIAIASALAAHRSLATRRTLRSRIAAAVVPADEFDVTSEEVLRVAAQLAEAERSVRGWIDRRASALRIRLAGDSESNLVYLLEVPARWREVLRGALRSYEGVELRDASEVLLAGNGEGVTLRTELVLAKPSIEPLARLDLNPDPLQPFAAGMTGLRQGEEVTVCLDLLPARGRRALRLRRTLRREARRAGGESPGWRERLGADPRSTRREDPATLAERRIRGRALDAKLRDAGPSFEAQLLLCVRAPARPAARARMQGLLAAFGPLADRNWLRASGLAVPGLAFLGSDLPLRRRTFDRRLDSGLFRPARRNILTARELAGFLKPPTVHCLADNVLRSGALLPAPPALPDFAPEQSELIPLGRIAGEGGERLVGVRSADTFFSYVAGRSRYGKTELAIVQFLHLVRSGQGGLFLDPHEDALARIKPYLTAPGVRERVVEINLGSGRSGARQPGWNLFELGGEDPGEAEARVEAIVDAFASALQWGERSTRAINLTAQAAGALAAIAKALPPEQCPTVFQLPTLLSDDGWRAGILPFLPRSSQRFWLDRFPRLADEAITPLTNMVDRLRASGAITALLGTSQSTYRAREAMDRGLIVLTCPGSGGTRDRLLANLLVFDLLHAAKGRADVDPERRRPFWVFLDEVQSYDGAASGNLAALLEQSAKYGLRATILNQNPERLSPQTLNALTTNRSHLLSSALNSHAASLIAREWGGQPDPAALTRLPRYRFIGQVTDHGDLSRPFALGGVSVEEVFGEGRHDELGLLEEAIDAAAGRQSPAEAAAHIEDLDERIAKTLRRLRRQGGEGRPEPEEPSPGPLRVNTGRREP